MDLRRTYHQMSNYTKFGKHLRRIWDQKISTFISKQDCKTKIICLVFQFGWHYYNEVE